MSARGKRESRLSRFSLFDMIAVIETGRKRLSVVSLAVDFATKHLISLELGRRSAYSLRSVREADVCREPVAMTSPAA